MHNIGAIILCRYNSSRLPGKILRKVNNKPILEYIVEKLLTIFDRSNIIVATSTEESDDPIIEYCECNSINYYRGSLNNVAQRFLDASLENQFDFSVRINGDNLFLDTEIIRFLLTKTQNNNYDFISNVKGRTFPKGMSVEIVNVNTYKEYINLFTTDAHFEHVTKYLYENDEDLDTLYISNERFPEAAGEQLAIDTIDDYRNAKEIFKIFTGDHRDLGLERVYKLKKQINE